MDHFRKVQSGQKLEIPAETFNSFIDAAQDFKERQRNRGSTPEPYFPDSGIILVANQSGEDRNQFDVLGVTEPIIRPEANLIEFKRRPTFRGVKPTETHKCRFVVLLEPVKANKIAHAAIAGVTIVHLRIDDPLDTCCDIEPEKCDYLQTCIDGSAQILWKEKNSGTCWVIIRLGNCCEPDESSSSSSWSDSSSLSESSSSPSDSSVSESSSDESLSEESSEVSESPSESESDECCGCRGVSGTVRVLVAEPYRSGDDLCFPMADLKFVDGCYQGMAPAGESCQYICCDESSSSCISDESSIDESSSPSSDESLSPSQSDLSEESSSPSQDSSLSDSPSESSYEDSSVSPSESASESGSSSAESSTSQSSEESSLDQSTSDPSWSDDSSLSDSDSSSSSWGGW